MRATGVRSFQLNGTPVCERRGEEVGERDDDGVGVALLALDVEEALGARPARLVDDDERRGESLCFSAMPRSAAPSGRRRRRCPRGPRTRWAWSAPTPRQCPRKKK